MAIRPTNQDDSRLLSFYLRAAVKVLFVNILTDPLKPQAKSDLDLMRSAAILIRNMPGYNLSYHEAGSMQSVDCFVDELIRLGNCAILKSAQERNQVIQEQDNLWATDMQ